METDLTMILNIVANIVLTIAFTMFLIFVFGRTNSRIYQLPWYKTILVKVGLASCTVGAFLNVMTFSNPPISEVILNMGLSFMFVWAAWFHYKTFVIPYKEMSAPRQYSIAKTSPKRKPRKKTATTK